VKYADVLIVGAGPAGASAARVLSLAGLHVIMTDPIKKITYKIGESLPGAAMPLLRDIGLLPWFEMSFPKICYGNLSSWGNEHLVSFDFIRDPNGTSWHLDRPAFDASLREAAQNAGAKWLKLKLENLTKTESHKWRASFNGEEIESTWLIDASGRRSICAQKIGIKQKHDKPLIALFSWGKNFHKEERTLIESVPYGWWYSAPIPNNKRVIALHIEAKNAAYIIKNPDEWENKVKETTFIKKIYSHDHEWQGLKRTIANGMTLEQFGGKNWLAIGDAALAFDPISSQGIFNALYTGLRGAQAIIASFKGHQTLIEEYFNQLNQVRITYLKNIKYFYSLEQRWKNQEFWKNRLELNNLFI
jgi:flavin-dependent dehydrogenase